MFQLEQLVIELLLNFFSHDTINLFLRDPQNTATIVGSLIAISGALLGTFLLLRGLSMTSDAISHTVLLGIVLSFFILQTLDSPLLILGAALMGVLTVNVGRDWVRRLLNAGA